MKQIEEKFNITLTRIKPSKEPYFEIRWEGDWNDADYVHRTETIPESRMTREIISFLNYYNEGITLGLDEDSTVFNIMRDRLRLDIPYGYEQDIHSLTWDISYFKDGFEYDVQLNPLTKEDKIKLEELLVHGFE